LKGDVVGNVISDFSGISILLALLGVIGFVWGWKVLIFRLRMRYAIPYGKAESVARKKIAGKTNLQIENIVRKIQRFPPTLEAKGVVEDVSGSLTYGKMICVKESGGGIVECHFEKMPGDAEELNKGDSIRIIGKLHVFWDGFRFSTSFVESRVV